MKERFPGGENEKENIFETRKVIIAALKKELMANPAVKAAFVVGSDAANRLDEYSDIDLDMIVDKAGVEGVEKKVKACLEVFSPIKTELTRTTQSGDLQKIYQFEKISKFLHVDVIYMTSMEGGVLDEPKINVLFDKEGLINPAELTKEVSEAEINEKIRERIDRIEKYNELRQTYVERELKRGHFLGAFEKYRFLVLEILIEVLRMQYCPRKMEYSVKHIETDLPEELVREIEDLYKVSSLEDIREKNEKANRLLMQVVEELKKGFDK